MEEVEKEISLRNSELNFKLVSYTPDDIDESEVSKKIYLKKFTEIDETQEELVNLIDRFLLDFPKTERKYFYEGLQLKAISNVNYFKRLIKTKVIQLLWS